jgi:hypothetical protein
MKWGFALFGTLLGAIGAAAVNAGQQFMATTTPQGIEVYDIWSASGGQAVVKGGPFVPRPVPLNYDNGTELSPNFIATHPSGTYLYALYGVPVSPLILWSFKLVNGVPHQINSVSSFLGSCCESQPFVEQMVATAHYVWILTPSIYGDYGTLTIFQSTNGTLKLVTVYALGGINNGVNPGIVSPTSLTVDPNELFAYVTYPSAANYLPYGTCTADQCVAIYDLDNKAAPILIATLPLGDGLGFSASVK